MENREKIIKIIGPFIITAIILLGVFYFGGIYPFGDKILFKWDMELQYTDFFRWWNRVLHGKASMTYSFSKSLGDNAIGLTAYYLSSPFNLLLYFTDNIPLFVSIITILKMAAASLTGSLFLEKVSSEMNVFWHLILSIAYGLMAYNMCQASNIMWLDGVVWLPIVSLGVWKLINEQKSILLYFSVIIAILSNWYTAYMICLFSFFYYVYEILKKNDFSLKNIIKSNFGCFIKYCITMVSAVFTTMVFFLPVILNLLQGKGIESSDKWIVGFHTTAIDFLKGCFVMTVPYTDQGLTLFCGTITMLALIAFLFSKKISGKEKIWSVVYLAFFIVCAVFIPLENVWNGFRKVASYYCRFSFIISFFCIYLASVFLSGFLADKKGLLKNAVLFICLLLTCVEFSYSAYETFTKGYGRSYAQYNEYVNQEKNLLSEVKQKDTEQFYRMEQTASWRTIFQRDNANYNEPLAYGFMPLSSYSSTYNSNIMSFYNQCGYSSCSRLITWREPMLVSDSLLGIKYILGDFNMGKYKAYTKINGNGKILYENPYALSLGYPVSEKMKKEINAHNTFEYQNELLSKIVGRKVKCYKRIKVKARKKKDGYVWKLPKLRKNSMIYGYCTYVQGNELDLYVDNEYRNYYSEWYSYKTFQVGNGQEKRHTVKLEGKINRKENVDGIFYYLDMKVFKDVMKEISKKQVDVAKIEDGKVECDYKTDKKELLLLTVPYDTGWNVTVNGKKANVQELQGVFTGIEVSSGQNKIKMNYVLPGLRVGSFCSVLGIVIYVISEIIFRQKSKKGFLKQS